LFPFCVPVPYKKHYFILDAPKPGIMGNNHSNDYRPDPTTARADRIRGGSAGGDKDRGGGDGGKKNGYRSPGQQQQQLTAGQSPSHMVTTMGTGQILSSQVARWVIASPFRLFGKI
jgi:hypothetical protein